MSAQFSAADLRAIADTMDALTETAHRTGVTVDSYGDSHNTYTTTSCA